MQAGQLQQEHLSFLQNVLNFIFTKYLKQEVGDDLSVCVDERSPCSLFQTGDIRFINLTWSNGNDAITQMVKCPVGFYQGVVFTAQIW